MRDFTEDEMDKLAEVATILREVGYRGLAEDILALREFFRDRV